MHYRITAQMADGSTLHERADCFSTMLSIVLPLARDDEVRRVRVVTTERTGQGTGCAGWQGVPATPDEVRAAYRSALRLLPGGVA